MTSPVQPCAVCPSLTELSRLALGQSWPRADAVEAHVLACAQCAARLAELSGDDVLLGALRGGPPAECGSEADALAGELVARLARLGVRDSLLRRQPPDTSDDLAVSAHVFTPVPGALAAAAELPFLAPPEAPDELGRLGGYRILQVLGRGGMGVVLRAEDPQLRRQVALKIIRPEAAAYAKARDRFLREARAVAALEHDNIVPIYKVEEDRGIPFIAMPLLKGESLADRLARSPRLPADLLVQLGRQVAAGLAAAHAAGLIHRDVKPGNLWLEDRGEALRVRLLDFGLARDDAADSAAELTRQGDVLGTPQYMAPEQARGETADPRADLFSLGVVLYEAATGLSPFARASHLATLKAITEFHPPPLHEAAPELPRPLTDLVMRLLAKRAADRPAAAREVEQGFRALVGPGEAATIPPGVAPADAPAAPLRLEDLDQLGGYLIRGVLGAGGMGVVFRAEDVQLERSIALKVIKPEVALLPGVRERFLREARAVAALDHEHIVPIYQVGEDRGMPFIAMPLLKGESLAELLQRGKRLLVRSVMQIGREVAAGLAAAHAKGLIHRDIKPGNLWLEQRPKGHRIRLLDFGLARANDGKPGQPLTLAGTLVGTPAYMAPEQARGEAVDGRADLFSLGCVLYEMLTGTQPFQRDALIATVCALESYDPPPPHEVERKVPVALSKLVMELLAKKRDERPSSADAVEKKLRALITNDGESLPPKPAPPPPPNPPQPPAVIVLPPKQDQRKKPRRHWAVLAGLLTGVTAVLAGVIIIIHQPGKPPTTIELAQGGTVKADPDRIEIYPAQPDVKPTPHPTTREKAGTAKVLPQPQVLPVIPKPEPVPPVVPMPIVPDPPPVPPKDTFAWVVHTLPAQGPDDQIATLAFSQDGTHLLSGGFSSTHWWNLRTQEVASKPPGPGFTILAALLPDGRRALAASDQLWVWDLANGKLLKQFDSPHKPYHRAALSPDGKFVALGGYSRSDIHVLDLETDKARQLRGHVAEITGLGWRKDGQLVSCSRDKSVRVWNARTGDSSKKRLLPFEPEHMAVAPKGNDLVFMSSVGVVCHLTIDEGSPSPARTLKLTPPLIGAVQLAVFPDGKRFAVAGDGGVQVRDLKSGEIQGRLCEEDSKIRAVAISPDGRFVATGGLKRDADIRVWEILKK